MIFNGGVDNTKDIRESVAQLNENKVDKTDIVDDFLSEDASKVLSANRGRILDLYKINAAPSTLSNIDDVSELPHISNERIHFNIFKESTTGTKPFSDGWVVSYIWRISSNPLIRQVAYEDNTSHIATRVYTNGSWSSWLYLFDEQISVSLTPQSPVASSESYNRAFYKNGQMFISIAFNSNAITVTTSNTYIFSMPSKYAPSTDVYFMMHDRENASTWTGYVGSNGGIYIRATSDNPISAGRVIRGTVTYFVGK